MKTLFFDIETIYDEDNKQDIESLLEKYWNKCDFLPELTKIITICCWYKKEDWEFYINNISWTEKEQIEKFFIAIKSYDTLCWFNIIKFDLPFIIKRAIHLGISIPDKIKYFWKKPRELNHIIDLQDVYSMNIFWSIGNLDLISKHLWIKTSKTNMSWNEVQMYYNNWKTDEIIKYCIEDVRATMEIYDEFLKFNLI